MPLSKIVANSITDNTITTDQIADTSVHGRRNLVINGDFQIAQRATSVTGVGGDGYQAVDRWQNQSGSLGTFTMSQSTTTPDGFGFSHKYDCTTADASPASSDFLIFQHRIEAQNLQHLQYGTSGAKSVTLSFHVRSNKTGTYIVELSHGDASSFNQQSYTINSADTWEKKTLTYVGQTSDVINNDNGIGMFIQFWLGAGSNYTSGTLTQNTWAATTAANRAAGQVNIADSTSNEWYITGIQLEVGSQATPFEHRSFGEELAACQRYYYKSTFANAGSNAYNTAPLHLYHAYQKNANHWEWTKATHPVTMRGTPGMTTVDGNGNLGKITHWTSQGGAVSHNQTPYTANASGGNASASEYSSSIWGFYCNYIADAEL